MHKFRKALAINPYTGDAERSLKGLFPATGLEYIAASLKGFVDEVVYLDLRYEPQYQDPKVLSEFIRKEIDLLCIGIQWNYGFRDVCEFITRLPHEVCTVVGGRKATEEVETLFELCPNIDMVVRGEGEEIIRRIAAGDPSESILGLSYRNNGSIVHNENQILPDIAKLPFPDRSLRRNDFWLGKNGIRMSALSFDTVLSTRGCPFRCKFCTFSLNPLGQKRTYSERPVESVIEELKQVKADIVLFSDDNFFTNPKRAGQLCDLIIENKIDKKFVANARIDVARHPDVLEKAVRAGFKLLLIGIESPHDRILKQISKGFTQQQIRDAFEVLSRFDLYLHGYFIYGNIGESEEEMLYIPQFAREIKVDSISFQKLRIEKFSPLKELVEQTPGYYYSKIGGSVYSETHGRDELKKIRDRIRKKFYSISHLGHMVEKALRIGMLSGCDMTDVLLRIPSILYAFAKGKSRKQWRAKALGK